MKLKLIPEARNWWRMLTVQFGLLIAGYGALPEQTQLDVIEFIVGLLPVSEARVPVLVGILIVVFRLIYQEKVRRKGGQP